MSLGQTYLDLGRAELSTGFIARAEQSFVSCIRVAPRILKSSSGFRAAVWKTVADAVFMLSGHSSYLDEGSVAHVLSEVVSLLPAVASDRLLGIIPVASSLCVVPFGRLKALEIAATAYDYRITLGPTESSAIGSSWFDLGAALHSWASKTIPGEAKEKASKQSIKCLTQALREEPGNDAYWNALGSVHFTTEPKTAQHAFIKSLEFNAKVSLWDCSKL
jgi:superkiller protein 3